MYYLKGAEDFVLCYHNGSLNIKGYTDVLFAYWGCDLDERKSAFGYIFWLNKWVISWYSKK